MELTGEEVLHHLTAAAGKQKAQRKEGRRVVSGSLGGSDSVVFFERADDE